MNLLRDLTLSKASSGFLIPTLSMILAKIGLQEFERTYLKGAGLLNGIGRDNWKQT